MPAIALALLALLCAASPGGDEPPPPATAPPSTAPPATAAERLDRALVLLRSGDDGPARVLAECRSEPAAVRRAALEALGTLPPGTAPAGTAEAAIEALATRDGPLRESAVKALLAAGPAAERALECVLEGRPVPGSAGLSRARAADALFDFLRRAGVEEEFLATWSPNDGSFQGMFAELKKRGPAAARVLTAIALDRRMAGGTMLGFGPYAFLHPPAAEQERSEVRYRALAALEDAGDEVAAGFLARSLRQAPAPALYDDFDEDPIPAALDDAIRTTLAALGVTQPLVDLVQASEGGMRGRSDGPIELRRQAMAYASLAEALPPGEARQELFTRATARWDRSIRIRQGFRWGGLVDGVDWYNFACIVARRDAPGDREAALGYLEKALDTYSVTSGWVARDGDLSNLRGEPRFAGLLKRLRDREAAMRGEGGK